MSRWKEKLARNWKKEGSNIFNEHPDWNAAQVRRQLIVILEEVKTPGISAVQKEMPKWKKEYQAIKETGLDKPWHLGVIREPEYSIAPEVIPDILAVQDWCTEEHPEVPFFQREPLTIRQALWISRLHGITNIFYTGKARGKNKELNITSWLWQWSRAYAQYEILCHMSSTPFDTSQLDTAIWLGAMPVAALNAVDLLYPDRIETAIEIYKKGR